MKVGDLVIHSYDGAIGIIIEVMPDPATGEESHSVWWGDSNCIPWSLEPVGNPEMSLAYESR